MKLAKPLHKPQILFIATIYQQYPVLVASLIAQKYTNWKLLLLHDGPNRSTKIDIQKIIDTLQDDRITYIETKTRKQMYGHHLRRQALIDLHSDTYPQYANIEYIVITNADNYHLPDFCEWMVKGFTSPEVKVVHCTGMVHNYKANQVIDIEVKLGYIDIAAVMSRRECACLVGWRSMRHSSDWTHINDMVSKYGLESFKRVPGVLVVHN